MTLLLGIFLASGCRHHGTIVPTWPGPQGRACEDKVALIVDPDPWAPATQLEVNVDGRMIRGFARQPLAVFHPDDLKRGFLLTIGSESCELRPTNTAGETHLCGEIAVGLHYTPLCDLPPMVEGLDRQGRPETGNFIIASTFGTTRKGKDLRELWNKQEPFTLAQRIDDCTADSEECDQLQSLRDAVQLGLERLDALDRFEDPHDARDPSQLGAGLDWCDAQIRDGRPACAGTHPLRELWLTDVLLVDTHRRCTVNTRSFLEIEASYLQGRPLIDGARNQTCGGRTLTDDTVDTLLTFTINGPKRVPPGAPLYGPQDAEPDAVRGDGVHRSTRRMSEEFPYLPPPAKHSHSH